MSVLLPNSAHVVVKGTSMEDLIWNSAVSRLANKFHTKTYDWEIVYREGKNSLREKLLYLKRGMV